LLIPGDTGNSIGRPKGTTDTNSRQLLEKVEEATQEVVNKFKEVKSKTRSSKHRLQKGSLKIIIASAKEKFNIPHDIIISENTVRQRVKRGSKSGHVGQSSPMLELEPYLVELIKKLADMRTPVTTAQGLELANSLIEGKSTQKQLIDWKSKNCHAYKMKGTVKLGKSYWRNFLRRNSHLIRQKKAVKFENKRAQWCNYLNMEEMYQEIYQNLCSAGIACKHSEAVWRNKDGEVVEQQEQAFGCKSEYELIHPDHLIFVDEVGSNTSQAKDGQVIGSEDNIEENCGDNKPYPFGPTCTFNGKEIPCFCCNSESGSITGPLLTSMLSYIDTKEVFDRSTGLSPFLLLDGHGSRCDLEFLEYINSEETKWHVNIGLPYGTSYWQVGDSTEQNGCFKMALSKAKQELVTKKNDAGLPFEINKTDIVK